jgi:hypothetical protein
VAIAVPVSAATLTEALAQEQPRDQVPIGHRQPRAQDLPPAVQQEEKKLQNEQDALDKKLENSICRGC